jgi:hypothetical protein
MYFTKETRLEMLKAILECHRIDKGNDETEKLLIGVIKAENSDILSRKIENEDYVIYLKQEDCCLHILYNAGGGVYEIGFINLSTKNMFIVSEPYHDNNFSEYMLHNKHNFKYSKDSVIIEQYSKLDVNIVSEVGSEYKLHMDKDGILYLILISGYFKIPIFNFNAQQYLIKNCNISLFKLN